MGRFRRPFGAPSGATGPFAQRKKGQTAQPPSASLAQGEGVSLGSRRGGGGIWRPGPQAPACQMESPGRGPRAPARAFRALCAPAAPPGRWDSANPNGTRTSYGM